MTHSTLYTAGHNAIVARVRATASRSFTVAYENRPMGTTTLRPDLVVVRGEEAVSSTTPAPSRTRPTLSSRRVARRWTITTTFGATCPAGIRASAWKQWSSAPCGNVGRSQRPRDAPLHLECVSAPC
ncbi:hypothetical protein HPB50_001554 [Hyalomma asiaticum]|uniref:Uncharacterized protein n=1 Tax=Hyalomma asiaticum TaxID=266040 RepID=A0ACB7SUP5_HYAAI|nr:hypothetical protein HPB50_001554 [Hyalomma asiaticum]